VPDAVLLKPGALNRDEVGIMREHARMGGEILSGSRSALLQMAEQIATTHHEKWDGSGYPFGLRGEAIPLGARIFAIADTLDAMTSDRPYRKALSFDQARAEIVRCSGSQFDPGIVQVFLTMPEALWNGLRSEVERGTSGPLGIAV